MHPCVFRRNYCFVGGAVVAYRYADRSALIVKHCKVNAHSRRSDSNYSRHGSSNIALYLPLEIYSGFSLVYKAVKSVLFLLGRCVYLIKCLFYCHYSTLLSSPRTFLNSSRAFCSLERTADGVICSICPISSLEYPS